MMIGDEFACRMIEFASVDFLVVDHPGPASVAPGRRSLSR